MNRYTLGAIILSDPVLETLRRELQRLSPDSQIDAVQFRSMLASEVLKRKVTESDQAAEAQRLVERMAASDECAPAPKRFRRDTLLGRNGDVQ